MKKDDLKCCGNCEHRNSVDMGEVYEENCNYGEVTASMLYCNRWKFDGFNQEDRYV